MDYQTGTVSNDERKRLIAKIIELREERKQLRRQQRLLTADIHELERIVRGYTPEEFAIENDLLNSEQARDYALEHGAGKISTAALCRAANSMVVPAVNFKGRWFFEEKDVRANIDEIAFFARGKKELQTGC